MKMGDDVDRKLCELFPEIFKDRHNSSSDNQMVRGFNCGEGWYTIIVDLCKKLEVLSYLSGLDIRAGSVFEKYGKLKFGYNITEDDKWRSFDQEIQTQIKHIINDLIGRSESRSCKVCEICGQNGKLDQVRGWFSTRCPVCREKYDGPAEPGNERERWGEDGEENDRRVFRPGQNGNHRPHGRDARQRNNSALLHPHEDHLRMVRTSPRPSESFSSQQNHGHNY